MVFTVPDMTGWTSAQRAEFYEANADHVDEIFCGETATFVFDPDRTLTERDGVMMSMREAQTYDAKQDYLKKHPDAKVRP